MISDIKALFDFFLDKSRSIGNKTALFISIVGIAFIIDNCFDISYNLYISNKLDNLETLNNLKQVYKNDTARLQELFKTEQKIFNRKHYLDFLSFHISKIDFKSEKIDSKNVAIKIVVV
jgi:hypothetical protein